MEHHIRLASTVTELLDTKFSFLGIRFGLDPLLNIFPLLGDIIAGSLSAYLIWIAYRIHVPKEKINEMIGNVIFDFMLGLIPVIGNVSDIFYRANVKNLKILKAHYSSITEGEIISSPLHPSVYK